MTVPHRPSPAWRPDLPTPVDELELAIPIALVPHPPPPPMSIDEFVVRSAAQDAHRITVAATAACSSGSHLQVIDASGEVDRGA